MRGNVLPSTIHQWSREQFIIHFACTLLPSRWPKFPWWLVVFNYSTKENQYLFIKTSNLKSCWKVGTQTLPGWEGQQPSASDQLWGEVALPGPKGPGRVRLRNSKIYNYVTISSLMSVKYCRDPSLHLTGRSQYNSSCMGIVINFGGFLWNIIDSHSRSHTHTVEVLSRFNQHI